MGLWGGGEPNIRRAERDEGNRQREGQRRGKSRWRAGRDPRWRCARERPRPWAGLSAASAGIRAGSGGHAGVPSPASAGTASLQCPALPGPALGARSPFPGPPAFGGTSRAQRLGGRPGEAQRRRPSPRRPRPARRGGAEGAGPRPAGSAAEGGARPRTGAPRSRHKSARPGPPYKGRARHAARAPLQPGARAPALTSGQRGTVVHRDPDLLNPALSQLQRHLRSLGSVALSPLRRTQTRGTPRNKGEAGVRAQQRGPCALPGAAGGKGALC